MAISKTYNPTQVEDKWYKHWMEQDFFSAKPNPEKEPFCIVIPPPNVTGVLHMGHMLNNTIQDVLVRKARMEGKEACWVPGTDHASIATEAKVVNMLKEKGIDKNTISREEFMKHAWEWKEKYGGIILEQLKKLGASCDWNRTTFTMDEHYSESVLKVFVDLYNKGYIYRGYRMVNWDPQAKTAVSDEEVIYKEVNSKLYHVQYSIEGSEEKVIIATTRPETILGDTAICINPNDDRYKHLHGKRALVPFVNRSIPIILDEYVDMEFGTGCLKVTPAHDLNDYELGKKHNLEFIDILNDDGTLSKAAQKYIGEDRFVVRKKIAKDLKAEGFLVKEEDYKNKVGCSERTDAVIEPKVSIQWFMKMQDISKPALKAVMEDDVQLHPAKFKNTYRHWMENVQDWCISRQLWWGHRIPAYFYGEGVEDYVVALNADEAVKLAIEKTGDQSITEASLRQDEDVLDTWASSWLWPIAVFDGINKPDNEDVNYFYPTNDLVTAPEILFFWVARMIIAGYEYKGDLPFKNVYLTGIVRDKQRRKMSKSLGNSPDPLDLIKLYGADGVRTGMLFSSPAGNDLLFDEKLCEQGRNFTNKLWNSYRLISGWETVNEENEINNLAVKWFEEKFNEQLVSIEDHFSKYRMSDALMGIYKLIWDDFCSWYLEMIKPAYGDPIDKTTFEATISFFERLLKVLHPFMPFITEELWHEVGERGEKECIIIEEWPKAAKVSDEFIAEVENLKEVVTALRNARNSNKVPVKELITLHIKTQEAGFYDKYEGFIKKLALISEVNKIADQPEDTVSFVVKADELFITNEFDAGGNKEDLEKELEYMKGFLMSVEKKLSNERFVNNAPEQVVANEKKKRDDAAAKIKALEQSLTTL